MSVKDTILRSALIFHLSLSNLHIPSFLDVDLEQRQSYLSLCQEGTRASENGVLGKYLLNELLHSFIPKKNDNKEAGAVSFRTCRSGRRGLSL